MLTLPITLVSCAALLGGVDDEPILSILHVPNNGGFLALRDVNGDGRIDLLSIEPRGFGLRYLAPDGSYPGDPECFLPWPGPHLAWDIVDLDGDGAVEVMTLSGEGEVRAWRPDDQGGWSSGKPLLVSKSYLPHGVTRMRFARDVDGNGLVDLVLPAAGRFRIHLQDAQHEWSDAFEIDYEADVNYDVGDPEELDSNFGQSIRIPWFRMEDVDGDGTQDLISRTEGRVDFHLARPELAPTATWTLDLASLEEGLTESGAVDLDDLLSNIDQGVKWSLEEIDGQPPRDLVLQLGATIKVYLGGSSSGTDRPASQVLKISGNLLHYFVRDVGGDALPDLQLLRGERISLGRVLRWLILPGSLDFEFFTYENAAGKFSNKPTRRNTVALKIPRLLSLLDDIEELEGEFERQRDIPARRFDFDGDGVRDDIVDIDGGRVLFFDGCAPPGEDKLEQLESGDVEQIVETFVLNDVDELEDGETRTIDLGSYRDWDFSPGATLRDACKDQEPSRSVATPTEEGNFELSAQDLDGDGRDDVVIWVQLEDGGHLVQFLVLPPKP